MFENSGFLQHSNFGKFVLRSSGAYDLGNCVACNCIFGELDNFGLEEFMCSGVVDFETL